MCLIRFPFWKATQFDQNGRRKCRVQGRISVGIRCARLPGLSLVRNFVSFGYMYVVSFFWRCKAQAAQSVQDLPGFELCGSAFSFPFCSSVVLALLMGFTTAFLDSSSSPSGSYPWKWQHSFPKVYCGCLFWSETGLICGVSLIRLR